MNTQENRENLETFVPMTFQRRGVRQLAVTDAPAHNITFLEGLGRAFYWQHLLDTGVMKSGAAIARAEGLEHRTVNRLLSLTLLAPDLVEMLMGGRQPRRLTLRWALRHPLPIEWQAQRQLFANFEKETS